MAFQYWRQRGEERRTKFVSLRMAYHGDTIGSVSVGGIDLFHSLYRPLLFDTLHAEPGDAADMERLLAEHEGEVAAVIIEPLVQGAAGMLVHPEGYLRAVRELCDRHGVLLILDEVATGFGRTGRMFACEHEGVAPDLLCLAKGITGGYLPLAATLATRGDLRGLPGPLRGVPHLLPRPHLHGQPARVRRRAGHARRVRRGAHARAAGAQDRAAGAAARADRRAPRGARGAPRGFMTGIELAEHPLAARMGHQVTLEARRRGAIIRPLGDVVVLMPPLSISEGELTRLVAITAEAIDAATASSALPQASLASEPAGLAPVSPRRARSPSCAPRRPGRTSRPGSP